MDPTEVLDQIREATAIYQDDPGVWEGSNYPDELASRVIDLDVWMSKGGFLPAQWCLQDAVPRGRPRRETDGSVILDGYPHGSRSTYNRGCRCLECTGANREAGARARMRAQAKTTRKAS